MLKALTRIGPLTLAASMAISATASAQSQIDLTNVSDTLKGISRYGSGARDSADKSNTNAVGLVTGTTGGTYAQIGAELASVLDDGNELRILPIMGRGSVQNLADILFVKGVDLGIVRSDT